MIEAKWTRLIHDWRYFWSQELSSHVIDDILFYPGDEVLKRSQGFFAGFANWISIGVNEIIQASFVITYFFLVIVVHRKFSARNLCCLLKYKTLEPNNQVFGHYLTFLDISFFVDKFPDQSLDDVPWCVYRWLFDIIAAK